MKSQRVTIQTEATNQYFPVMHFIIPYKVILTFPLHSLTVRTRVVDSEGSLYQRRSRNVCSKPEETKPINCVFKETKVEILY